MWGWLRRKRKSSIPLEVCELPPVPVKEARVEGQDDQVKIIRSALGFRYYQRDGKWYAQFKGTIWTLNDDDLRAIIRGDFNTPSTKEIYASVFNAVEKAKWKARKVRKAKR